MTDDVPPTVLIVEHSDTTRKILEHTFTAEGFIPVSMSSVQEAIFALKSIVPDLAVIQAVLPDASGMKVVQALRDDAAFRHVPVLMMSGSSDDRAVLQGSKGGYAAVFDKPFSLKKMVEAARGLLGSQVG